MYLRKRLGLIAFFCVLGTGFSLFAQYILKFNPCVLCIAQRMALLGGIIVPLLLMLLPLRFRLLAGLTKIIASLPLLAGLATALYQIHLQHLPPELQPSCGAPWTFRLRHAPLFDWYEPLIRGTGNCGKIETLLGISLPVWSAMTFAFILVVLWWKTPRRR